MLQIRPLVPELAEVAQTNLNENEQSMAQDVCALRTWIEKQPHLNARTDDQFLIAFLRFCKYSLENTKKRIEFYYSYKTTSAELLKSRAIDDKLLNICRAGIFVTLPNPLTPGGPRIHFTRMSMIDTSQFTVADLFRFHVFRSEIEINTDDNWVISGVLEILDFSKIPFAFLRQFEPNAFRRMSSFLEYGVPTNLIGTHIVNASKETQIILVVVRNLMRQKELLHIHSSVESLQNAIGKEYLPAEYGGTNGTFNEAIETMEKQFLSFKEYFVEDSKYGVDEKLRLDEKAYKTYGSGGSFRKLECD